MTIDEAVDALMRDLNGRRGFRVDTLSAEVRDEMRGDFRAIVAQVSAPPSAVLSDKERELVCWALDVFRHIEQGRDDIEPLIARLSTP
jgi:hypothetical protein